MIQISVLITDATISLYKVRNFWCEQKVLERTAKDSESLVCEVSETLLLLKPPNLFGGVSSRTGHVKPCLNLGGPPPKAKYVL